MTEKDIESIVSQLGLTNGSNLVEDISKLNATLKSANTEYTERSRDPMQAEAIEKSRHSNLSKRDQEINALQVRITEEHLAELDSMAQGMMAGNFPINQNETSIDTEIELAQLKYDEELTQ